MANNNSAEKPPSARRKLYTELFVVVKVRDNGEAEDFQIHKELAVRHSEYFRGALSGGFKEAETGKVELEDMDGDTFAIFVDWLYRQTLPPLNEWEETYFPEEYIPLPWLLTDLYILADRLLVQKLKPLIVALASEYFVHVILPQYCVVERAFEKLPEESPFLDLLVDAYCYSWTPDVDDADGQLDFEQLPSNFVYRLMKKYAALDKSSFHLDPSNYQEPEQTER